MTNIGDGIKNAREHLEDEGRTGAFKMMVVITDGKANRPSGVDPMTYAIQQAQLAADAGICDAHHVAIGFEPTGVNRFLHMFSTKRSLRWDLQHSGIPASRTILGTSEGPYVAGENDI